MEVVIYAIVSIVLWMATMSVLLPFVLLLKFHKGFRNRWFSFLFYKCVGPMFESKLKPLRKEVFQLLEQHLSRKNTKVPLKVLEIGIGSGANLQYYPENSILTALDHNASFENYFIQNQKKYPQVKYERTVLCTAENMKDIEDSSMDLVISTYVLCSVTNVVAVLKEVKRVLKPGGKFLFLEHVSYPAMEWGSTLQSFTTPIWCVYFDGCYLNRNTDSEIKKIGFSNVVCEKKYPSCVMMFIRPQTLGIATK